MTDNRKEMKMSCTCLQCGVEMESPEPNDPHGICPDCRQQPCTCVACQAVIPTGKLGSFEMCASCQNQTDDGCPKSPTKVHEPDWTVAAIRSAGDQSEDMYLDISCAHCGQEGFIRQLDDLANSIEW